MDIDQLIAGNIHFYIQLVMFLQSFSYCMTSVEFLWVGAGHTEIILTLSLPPPSLAIVPTVYEDLCWVHVLWCGSWCPI